MINYAVVEIKGRQYKVTPGREIQVDFLGDVKQLESDKVLLLSEGEKVTIGAPYVSQKLMFEVVASKKLPKIRVATYHAKANTRKVRGSTRQVSVIKLQDKDREKKA